MTTITVQVPAQVSEPRGARLVALLATRLLAWIEKTNQARVEQRLRSLRQGEANEVRRYAQQHAQHDPRFAADLMAAADRHEQGGR